MRQPANAPTHSDDDIAIMIPDSKQKDPQYFNYLGAHGQKSVVECIEDTFKLNMWRELNDLSDVGCSVMNAIYSWCEMHGISIDYADTIRQRYYRIRDSYVKKGVDLRKRRKIYE